MIDYATRFSDSQSVPYGTDTVSTNLIDLKALGFENGETCPVWVVVEATNANITALSVQIQTSASEGSGFAAISTGVVSAGTSVPVGTYKVGTLEVSNLNRYVRLYYDVTGATSGELLVSAGVGPAPSNKNQG